jgi:hypothetical protein
MAGVVLGKGKGWLAAARALDGGDGRRAPNAGRPGLVPQEEAPRRGLLRTSRIFL